MRSIPGMTWRALRMIGPRASGIAAVIAATLTLAGCAPQPARRNVLEVVATFYPLQEFAQRVGGERVRVRNLVPAGVEPHDYDPTPRDVVVITRAHVFVYNGAGFEPWIARLLPELPGTAVVVEATVGLPLAADQEGQADPHVWLDPVLAQQIITRIEAGLVMADPAGRDVYAANAARLRDDLRALHQRFAQRLADCRQRIVITSHAAFGYLARRYGLRVISISGLSPEAEPAPSTLAAIVNEARAHNVSAIYYETLVSPRVAETIAREVGAKTLVLNPLEGLTDDEIQAGMNYVTVMHDNLENLTTGLGCRP